MLQSRTAGQLYSRLGIGEPLAGAPKVLRSALDERSAQVERVWREDSRTYLRASSIEGDLFARYGSRPSELVVVEHEAAVRTLVGATGPLRSPLILDYGSEWLLQQAIDADPLRGSSGLGAASV